MKDQSYTTAIEVNNSAEEVFNCLTNIPKWWTKDFEGSNTSLNDEFVICHPGQHYSKQRVAEVIPGKKVIWLVTESELSWLETDKNEWTGTRMIFELTRNDGKTLLRFTHEGLVPGKGSYGRCSEGWAMVIKDQLFNFITVGKTI